jgi:two-component system response regulator CpxR
MERVLLIDDDAELCRLLMRFLLLEGFDLQWVSRGLEGIERAFAQEYRLIMIDVMMPDTDGFEVLRQIRQRLRTPVLMLTARGDTDDRIRGLEMGADDYLPKPFDPAELAARMRAILRRTSPHGAAAIRIGDVELDSGSRTVRRGGSTVDLTTVEFDLLFALMQAAGAPVSRQELVRSVLGREFSPFDRSIDTHVCNLRRKLGPEEQAGERIKGVRGSGYLYALPSKPGAR